MPEILPSGPIEITYQQVDEYDRRITPRQRRVFDVWTAEDVMAMVPGARRRIYTLIDNRWYLSWE